MLTGEGAGGMSTEVADLAGEKGTGEGVGGTCTVASSPTSAGNRRKTDVKITQCIMFFFYPACPKRTQQTDDLSTFSLRYLSTSRT